MGPATALCLWIAMRLLIYMPSNRLTDEGYHSTVNVRSQCFFEPVFGANASQSPIQASPLRAWHSSSQAASKRFPLVERPGNLFSMPHANAWPRARVRQRSSQLFPTPVSRRARILETVHKSFQFSNHISGDDRLHNPSLRADGIYALSSHVTLLGMS